MKIGILASHPIQYQAPLFRQLARRADLVVYFAHRQSAAAQAAAGFGVEFDWDMDLLAGYTVEFLPNIARNPAASRFLGCNTPSIADRIRDGNFDAFIVTGWHLLCYWQAIRACRRHGVPVLVRGDSHLGTPRSFAKRLLKAWCYPRMLRTFSAFLYVGARNRQYLQHYGVGDDRLFFVPHCIDVAAFAAAAAAADVAALRRQWSIGDGQKVVLFAGKLLPGKRPQDLLQALHLLQSSPADVVGMMVGDGPLRASLEQQAAAMAIDVRFAGFCNQRAMPGLYAMADVLVLPSASETWGLVVNEALACGTPVVVSAAVGCAPDMVEPGRTGGVYATGDASGLAAALLAVLNGGSDAAAMARKSAQYSLDAAVQGILHAVASVQGR